MTNGTAVLGLGNIGPLASKPVMEGKGVLFKNLPALMCLILKLAQNDPDKFIEAIASLEAYLRRYQSLKISKHLNVFISKKNCVNMNIPVFHDDQHGTAIIASAALLNAPQITGKNRRYQNCGLWCGCRSDFLFGFDLYVRRKRTHLYRRFKGIITSNRANLDSLNSVIPAIPKPKPYRMWLKARTCS